MNKLKLVFFVVVLAASPAVTNAQTMTAQQSFDAGTKALDNKQYTEALTIFENLEKLSIKDTNVQGVIKVRKGEALKGLKRRVAAQNAFSLAMEKIDKTDRAYTNDVFIASKALGIFTYQNLEYRTAIEHFKIAAAAATTDGLKVTAMAGQVLAEIFVDTNQALITAKAAYDITADNKEIQRKVRAQAAANLGRVYLNLQQPREARKYSGEAVRLLGGLTLRTDIQDIQARGDHAIASALMDDESKMRRYLSYTGAGRFDGSSFLRASDIRLPVCDPKKGITPEDVVIVEFGINRAGEVNYSFPVYSNKPQTVALQFAQSVKNWSWTAEGVSKIAPFYRAHTRLELRCSTKTPAQPSPFTFIREKYDSWIGDQKYEHPANKSEVKIAGEVLAELASMAENGDTSPGSKRKIALWRELANNASVAPSRRKTYLDTAILAATKLDAPSSIILYFEFFRPTEKAKDWADHLENLMKEPRFTSDAIDRAVLALTIADRLKRGKRAANIETLLQAVLDDHRLMDKHPLKVGAQIRLASLYEQTGEAEKAKMAFQSTGLSPDQCATLDARPKLVSTGNTSRFYPTDMLYSGITGFSNIEYDVTADGAVANERVVMAYPPFGFTNASKKIIAQSRFEKSYRPDGGLGCSTDSNSIKFSIPD